MGEQRISRRLGNRKTTTGCITCKARKVKCGEERPHCHRCTSTGRRCDGYKDPDIRRPSPVTAIEQQSSWADCALIKQNLNADELEIFHAFTRRVAPQIAGSTDAEFWVRLVPQLCHSEQAIQHAAIAIGSLVMQGQVRLPHRGGSPPTFDQRAISRDFALEQYSKAIKSTIATINSGHASNELATVTCMLFVCIEALQGRETQAIVLFHRGQAALRALTNKTLEDSKDSHSKLSVVHQDISSAFHSFGFQLKMFDLTASDKARMREIALTEELPEVAVRLMSLKEAKVALLEILTFVQAIAYVGNELKWDRAADAQRFTCVCSRQAAVDHVLQLWHQNYRNFITSTSQDFSPSPGTTIQMSVLLQQYHIARVWLAGSCEAAETCYDNLTPQFEAVVAEATTVLNLTKEKEDSMTFCLDIGMIPALYWTAIKCRHPYIRREALSLLLENPIQEGLWNGTVAGKVAQRVIQIEEQLSLEDISSLDLSDGIAFPREERRIKTVRINLRTSVDGQEGDFVDFYSLPGGLESGWQIDREFIPLVDQ